MLLMFIQLINFLKHVQLVVGDVDWYVYMYIMLLDAYVAKNKESTDQFHI